MQLLQVSVIPAWFCRKNHGDHSYLFGARYSNYLKRCVDIAGAIMLLLLFLPAVLIIALLVKISSKGPVIFRQKRVGLHGETFVFLKFRSMHVHPEENDSMVVQLNDRRLTAFGKWLRPSHLDELPQLWNVLRGEMSLVGPRPRPLPHTRELTRELPGYAVRHFSKPGITGLAQVMLKHELSLEHFRLSLEYDLVYIRHSCLLNDLAILWRTVFVVLGRKGL